jgi:hypothetical protein
LDLNGRWRLQYLSYVWGSFTQLARRGVLKFSNCAMQHCCLIEAATDGRATTTAKLRKAAQHPIDAEQRVPPE